MARKRQAKARCLYCGAEGVTHEHVFARSLGKLFPGHGTFRLNYEHPELGVRYPPKRAPTFMIKSRHFCRDCNSGWMNQIDQDVRRLLHCFALDAPNLLDAADQRHLALWTTKTVLGLLSIEPEGFRFADAQLYQQLFATREPLTRSQIWLGANAHGDVAWGRSHALRFEQLADDSGAFGFTLSFGYGVLHFVQHADDDALLRLHMAPHRALRQIWPIAEPELRWPPRLRIAPTGLTGLAIEISRNCVLVHRQDPRSQYAAGA